MTWNKKVKIKNHSIIGVTKSNPNYRVVAVKKRKMATAVIIKPVVVEPEKMVSKDGVYMAKSDFVNSYHKDLKRQFPLASDEKIKKRGSDMFDSRFAHLFK